PHDHLATVVALELEAIASRRVGRELVARDLELELRAALPEGVLGSELDRALGSRAQSLERGLERRQKRPVTEDEPDLAPGALDQLALGVEGPVAQARPHARAELKALGLGRGSLAGQLGHHEPGSAE